MEKDFFDDTFLARWLSEELTVKELSDFEKHPEYLQYVRIKQTSDKLRFTSYDVDGAFNKMKVKQDCNKKAKTKSKVIPLYRYISVVAASVLLLVGMLFFYNNSKTTYTTNIASTKKIMLPDGSEMELQAHSVAKVAKNWDTNRNLGLEGEAYFKVKKGQKFTVNTDLGAVQVLGTQFSVNILNKSLFTVKCFEGKVRVKTPKNTLILMPGQAYQWVKGSEEDSQWNFSDKQPRWVSSSEVNFNKVPLPLVIESLKNHYNVSFDNQDSIPKEILFTGNFKINSLNSALYTIFSTVGLRYEISDSKVVKVLH